MSTEGPKMITAKKIEVYAQSQQSLAVTVAAAMLLCAVMISAAAYLIWSSKNWGSIGWPYPRAERIESASLWAQTGPGMMDYCTFDGRLTVTDQDWELVEIFYRAGRAPGDPQECEDGYRTVLHIRDWNEMVEISESEKERRQDRAEMRRRIDRLQAD